MADETREGRRHRPSRHAKVEPYSPVGDGNVGADAADGAALAFGGDNVPLTITK
jgi:hypothetical protein